MQSFASTQEVALGERALSRKEASPQTSSDQFRPVWQTSLADQFGRPVWGRPVWGQVLTYNLSQEASPGSGLVFGVQVEQPAPA